MDRRDGMRKNSFFGDKAFYRHVFSIMIPIMVQGAFTNFVNMLDNLMVGRLGTAEMTGVSIANQFVFVYMLCMFGAVSGAGIFTAQYHGSGDKEGVQNTFRFKLVFTTFLAIIFAALLFWKQDALIGMYLKGEAAEGAAEATFSFAKQYLNLIMLEMIPMAICQSFASTLRETDHAMPPMIAGIAAVLVNLCLNYILIFGKLGAPQLGVAGAAIATVVSRFVELLINLIWCAANPGKAAFFQGVFRHFRIPRELAGKILLKGLPLMLNETLWSAGLVLVDQCYSLRGLNVVSAQNIAYTFYDLFCVAFTSCGSAIGIIIGQELGAGELAKAKGDAKKLCTLSIGIGTVVGLVFAALSSFIPQLYNTTDEVRHLAAAIMLIFAAIMPMLAYCNATYFIVRAGGKTLITMLTDSGYVWLFQLTAAFFISRYTDIPVIPFYVIVQSLQIIKVAMGTYFVRKGIWLTNIVGN